MKITVVGCGGIGGWVAMLLARMLDKTSTLVLVDGDDFESRNRDRQIACRIGTNKAEALKRHIRAKAEVLTHTEYLSDATGIPNVCEGTDVWMCCVDNDRARTLVLDWVDKYGGTAVLGANEYTDAEAYIYFPEWLGTDKDPREFYEEMRYDKSGDPLSPSCTGEAQEASPQLALANMSAAQHMCWLWYSWCIAGVKVTDDAARAMLVRHIMSSKYNMIITRSG